MSAELFSILITILTTAATALVAGVISYAAGRGMKTHEWNLQMARERLIAREALYADFLSTAAHYSLQSITRKLSDPVEFSDLTQKLQRISLVATEPVVHAARELWDSALAANAEKPDEEKVASSYERKQAFILEARKELASLTKPKMGVNG